MWSIWLGVETTRCRPPTSSKIELVRVCAPLDLGPLRGSPDGIDRYQFWDLEAKRKPYNLAVVEADIVKMAALDETFEPADIITWAFKPGAWRIPRDWGSFS